MGGDNISKGQRDNLERRLNNLNDALIKIMDSYSHIVQFYTNSMQKSLGENQYFSQIDLIRLHQNTKNEAIRQVCW